MHIFFFWFPVTSSSPPIPQPRSSHRIKKRAPQGPRHGPRKKGPTKIPGGRLRITPTPAPLPEKKNTRRTHYNSGCRPLRAGTMAALQHMAPTHCAHIAHFPLALQRTPPSTVVVVLHAPPSLSPPLSPGGQRNKKKDTSHRSALTWHWLVTGAAKNYDFGQHCLVHGIALHYITLHYIAATSSSPNNHIHHPPSLTYHPLPSLLRQTNQTQTPQKTRKPIRCSYKQHTRPVPCLLCQFLSPSSNQANRQSGLNCQTN